MKNVQIVRSYKRIDGVVVPITLESTAHVRTLGPASFRMSYLYSEIDGRHVSADAQASAATSGGTTR